MKILLVCAGGMSSSILMRKMEAYAAEHGIEPFEIAAVGVMKAFDVWQGYDCLLLAPQVAFNIDRLSRKCLLPIEPIAPLDYGRANCESIFAQVKGVLG